MTDRRLRYGVGGLILIAAALIYLITLDNGLRPEELVGGDLITHQYAQVEARPSNAPGYPLYTMGGWLWFRLGKMLLGWALNPIQVLSLYSTLWGLASLLVLYLILLELSDRQWPIAALLTLFYGTTFFFWYYSVTTEQYSSALFQTLLVIWLAFKWDEQPHPSTLLWLALVTGTMAANMVTTLFILPPLLWFILFKRDKAPGGTGQYVLISFLRNPALIFRAVGLVLLPLLSYAYVYIRGAQHPEWRGDGTWETTGAWFIQFLTIQQGRDELAPGLTFQNFFTAEFPALMWQELTWLVFIGGLLGLAFLGRRRAIFLYSTLLIYFFFSWGYRFGNWFQVIIPAYPIFVIGFGVGIRSAVARLAGRGSVEAPIRKRDRRLSPVRPVILLFLTGLVIYRFTGNWAEANQRNRPEDTGLDPGWLILADQPQRPAIISGTFAERVALQYLKGVWGVASGLYPTEAGQFDPPSQVTVDDIRRYVTRGATAADPEALRMGESYPQAAGEQLIGLWSVPRRELPPAARPAAVDFGDRVRLVGWEQIETGNRLPPEVAGRLSPANWQLALYWQTSAPIPVDYTISVRPLQGGRPIITGGEAIIQDHQPVWGVYPTGRWQPGEIVRDVYALSLPTPPEAVQIVVYRTTEGGFENLAEEVIVLGDGGQ